MRFLALGVLASSLAACVPSPIAPPAPRAGTPTAASFTKTWNSVIDIFAERNIQIKTIDKSSGLIVAEPSSISTRDGSLADCGTSMGVPEYPTAATWNVLVRGDSSSSNVKATVRFVRSGMGRGILNTNQVVEDCSSKGTWETAFEESVKQRAEGKTAGTTR